MAGDDLPAPDQRPADVTGLGWLEAVLRQRARVDAQHQRFRDPRTAGDQQGGLGHSVAGIERGPAKTVGGERLREPVKGFGADRLGSGEGHLPTAQVEIDPLLLGDPGHAEVEGEVRPAAVGSSVVRDRPQPAGRPLQETERRHEGRRVALVSPFEETHEPHVVVRRQPDHGVALGAVGLEHVVLDRPQVGEKIGVADHDALGAASGAGGVLQEGEVLRAYSGTAPPARSRLVHLVHRQPGQRAHRRGHSGDLVTHEHGRGRRQQDRRSGVLDHPEQPREHTGEQTQRRRIGRDGHDSGVEAPEECGHVVEAGRTEDQCPVTNGCPLAQRDRDGPGSPIEGRAGQDLELVLIVAEKPIQRRVRTPLQNAVETIDECLRRGGFRHDPISSRLGRLGQWTPVRRAHYGNDVNFFNRSFFAEFRLPPTVFAGPRPSR